MINAKILSFTAKRVYFEVGLTTLPEDVNSVAAKAQGELGYDANGYGGPMYLSVEALPEGGYKLNWQCPASCD